MKLLVLDDNPWSLGVSDWRECVPGLTVDVLTHPEQIEKLTIEDLAGYGALLLDHRMPYKTGAEVATELRARSSAIPVFKIGSFNESGYPEGCMYLGKMLSIPKIRGLVKYLGGELTQEKFQEVLHGY